VGAPAEEDLKNWGQHTGSASVPDEIMRRVGEDLPGTVSFIFTCQVWHPFPHPSPFVTAGMGEGGGGGVPWGQTLFCRVFAKSHTNIAAMQSMLFLICLCSADHPSSQAMHKQG